MPDDLSAAGPVALEPSERTPVEEALELTFETVHIGASISPASIEGGSCGSCSSYTYPPTCGENTRY